MSVAYVVYLVHYSEKADEKPKPNALKYNDRSSGKK
jgi:hypothetical protein